MRLHHLTYILFIVGSMGILISSCEKDDDNDEGNETKISLYGDDDSHNAGSNCMSCHKSGGSGEGWFNVAGTVYDSLGSAVYPNATIHLFTGPNGTGTLKYSIQVDAKGNFYTTQDIDFSGGLYPAVTGASSTQFMGSATVTGQCNSCHGVSTNRIWAK